MYLFRCSLWVALFGVIPFQSSFAQSYQFNEKASTLSFELNHLGMTTAAGDFEDFDGSFFYDLKQVENTIVSLNIKSASVVSEKKNIPNLMRSEKFFWTDKFPEITFESGKIEIVSETEFNIHGDLTIRGKTLPAVFKTKLLSLGIEKDSVFFETHTFINRKAYGIGVKSWLNPLMIVMPESLKISLKVEGVPRVSFFREGNSVLTET